MTEVAPTAFFVSSLPANFLGERLCSRRSCGCTRRTERYTGRFGRPGHTRFHIQTQRTPLSLSLRLRTSTRAGFLRDDVHRVNTDRLRSIYVPVENHGNLEAPDFY